MSELIQFRHTHTHTLESMRKTLVNSVLAAISTDGQDTVRICTVCSAEGVQNARDTCMTLYVYYSLQALYMHSLYMFVTLISLWFKSCCKMLEGL